MDVNFSVYSNDADGRLVGQQQRGWGRRALRLGSTNHSADIMREMQSSVFGGASLRRLISPSYGGVNGGKRVSQVITDSYDVLYGDWPEEYNEVTLVLMGGGFRRKHCTSSA